MNKEKQIEIATNKDLEQILAIYEVANRQAHNFLDEEIIQISKNLIRDEYFEPSTTLIIKETNQIVAYVSMIDRDISDLFVDPRFQHRGFGTKLLMEAVNQYNCDTVHVFEKNQKAYDFYKYLGFKQVDQCVDDLSHEPSFVMQFNKLEYQN